MTTILNPGQNQRFGAVLLRGHLRLLAAGMKHSQLSGRDILNKVAPITGKTYKRGQYKQALADLIAWLDANPA